MSKRVYLTLVFDVVIAVCSFILSMYLRYGDEFMLSSPNLMYGAVILTIICSFVFLFFHIPMMVWKYTSLQDLLAITKASAAAVIIFMIAMFVYNRLDEIPRSLLLINWLLMLGMLGAPRFFYRILKEKSLNLGSGDKKTNILLVGVTDHSEQFLRITAGNKNSNYRIVAILDEDTSRHGRYIHNVRIYGGINAILNSLDLLKHSGKTVEKIVIAPDVFEGEEVAQLLDVADKCGITLSRLPRLTDFTDTTAKIPLRPIMVEDLLGRPQNNLNKDALSELICGRNVMITGAGGTIGGELVRQVALYKPAHICLYELSEFNLYEIEHELADLQPDIDITAIIGDVRDRQKLSLIMRRYMPHIVFHAAALKHVPMSEKNIAEAVLTNIIGTRNVADIAVANNVAEMIMISTDKAVNPTNVMGATKRIAESYIQALGKSKKTGDTRFATIRFGNVLGSTGSVIPLFKKQISRGGPVTVTDKNIKRYFMTVREAVELVMHTANMVRSDSLGESKIFVLDMGEPVLIDDLARKMIKLSGLQPDDDIEIKYTGLRDGEKMFEELFHDGESPFKTSSEGILLANTREEPLANVSKIIKKLEAQALDYDDFILIDIMKDFLPEYK